MDWSPLDWTWIDSHWTEADPIGLDWIDLELIESERIGLSEFQPVSEFRPALVRTVPVVAYIAAPELRADSPKYLDA